MLYESTSSALGTALRMMVRTRMSMSRTLSGCEAMYSSTDLKPVLPIVNLFLTNCGHAVKPGRNPHGDPRRDQGNHSKQRRCACEGGAVACGDTVQQAPDHPGEAE